MTRWKIASWMAFLAVSGIVVADRIAVYRAANAEPAAVRVGSAQVQLSRGWWKVTRSETASPDELVALLKLDAFSWRPDQGYLFMQQVANDRLLALFERNGEERDFSWGRAYLLPNEFAQRYLKPAADKSRIAVLQPGNIIAYVDEFKVLNDITSIR